MKFSRKVGLNKIRFIKIKRDYIRNYSSHLRFFFLHFYYSFNSHFEENGIFSRIRVSC